MMWLITCWQGPPPRKQPPTTHRSRAPSASPLHSHRESRVALNLQELRRTSDLGKGRSSVLHRDLMTSPGAKVNDPAFSDHHRPTMQRLSLPSWNYGNHSQHCDVT